MENGQEIGVIQVENGHQNLKKNVILIVQKMMVHFGCHIMII